MHDPRRPYHFMETAIRITTAAAVDHRLGVKSLNDLLRITEDVGGDARHIGNELTIWLGDQGDPASVAIVCDRLIEVLRAIRDHNAPPVDAPDDDEVDLPNTTGYGRLGAAYARQALEQRRDRIPVDAIAEDPDLGTWAPGEVVEVYGS